MSHHASCLRRPNLGPRRSHAWLLPAVLLAVVPAALAAGPHDRDEPIAEGSAIALEFTVRPDVLEPSHDALPLLCVTNQNSSSRRSVEASDSFAFEFGAGVLEPCESISVISPTGSLVPGDFTCDVVGRTVRITRRGPATTWPPFESVCARVPCPGRRRHQSPTR